MNGQADLERFSQCMSPNVPSGERFLLTPTVSPGNRPLRHWERFPLTPDGVAAEPSLPVRRCIAVCYLSGANGDGFPQTPQVSRELSPPQCHERRRGCFPLIRYMQRGIEKSPISASNKTGNKPQIFTYERVIPSGPSVKRTAL